MKLDICGPTESKSKMREEVTVGRVETVDWMIIIERDFHPISYLHRHLSNIDCLMAHTACLVCFISTVNEHSKKKLKMPWKIWR